ncbi:MAG: hypothetical protein ACI9WU_003273 [Myxococcota bacterium]|jgi:hypothetical protein
MSQSPVGRDLISDLWGDRWDREARPPAELASAETECERIGGRLPTATELHRGRAAGPWPLDGSLAGSPLWSATPAASAGARAIVDGGDGSTSTAAQSAVHPFRCVVPRKAPGAGGFRPESCNGPPEDPCSDHGDSRSDALDRPALDWVGAAWECRDAGAALPTIGQAQELAQGSGQPHSAGAWTAPSGEWMWTAQAVTVPSTQEIALATWRVGISPSPEWTWAGDDAAVGLATGAWARSTDRRAFRCLGRAPAVEVLAPAPPTGCLVGECIEADGASGRVTADATNWLYEVDEEMAFEVCRNLGGALPTLSQAAALFDAGWPPPEAPIWTQEVVLGGSSDVRLGVVVGPTSDGAWHPDIGSATAVDPDAVHGLRCIWAERRVAVNDPCPIGSVQQWSGNTLVCTPREVGTSCPSDGGTCLALGGEFRDHLTNAWDAVDRGALRFDQAKARCEELGARLPTASELVRIGPSSGIQCPSPGAPSVDFLWTLVPDSLPEHRIAVRLSDGAVSSLPEPDVVPYRCIWPASRGDLLDVTTCNGPQDYACQHMGLLRFDRVARPALPQPSAAWECAFDGGRLPTAREFAVMARGKLFSEPPISWLIEPLIGADGRPRYAVSGFIKAWSWGFAGNTALELGDIHPFRCVVSLGTDGATDWTFPPDWEPT